VSERFGSEYWRETSHYRRFRDYRTALEATTKWYAGLIRLTGRYLPRQGRHLDAGCGHGAFVRLMLRRGLDSYGVDASDWVIAEAKALAPDLAERVAVADVESSLGFPGSFELVSSLEVVEHLQDPVAAIELMAASIASGGRLLLSTPNPINRIPRNDPRTSDPTHINLHPPTWWRDAVEAAGLRIEREWTYYPIPLAWRLSPTLARWIPLGGAAGPGYLLIAQR